MAKTTSDFATTMILGKITNHVVGKTQTLNSAKLLAKRLSGTQRTHYLEVLFIILLRMTSISVKYKSVWAILSDLGNCYLGRQRRHQQITKLGKTNLPLNQELSVSIFKVNFATS